MIISVSVNIEPGKPNVFDLGARMESNGKPTGVIVQKISTSFFGGVKIFLSNGEVLNYRGYSYGTVKGKSNINLDEALAEAIRSTGGSPL